jgi:hypothetical protein
MKITFRSPDTFRQQLQDAGVPLSRIDAALAHVEQRGGLVAGRTVTIPDRFTREPRQSAVARQNAVGGGPASVHDVSAKEKAGRAMGSLGIHAFDEVQLPSRGRRAVALSDGCGTLLPEPPAVSSCGTEAPGRRKERAVALSDGCGTILREPPTVSSCGVAVAPRRRSAAALSDGCGGVLVREPSLMDSIAREGQGGRRAGDPAKPARRKASEPEEN